MFLVCTRRRRARRAAAAAASKAESRPDLCPPAGITAVEQPLQNGKEKMVDVQNGGPVETSVASEAVLASADSIEQKRSMQIEAMNVVDLADEMVEHDGKDYARNFKLNLVQKTSGSTRFAEDPILDEDGVVDPMQVIRSNLPPDPVINTPFGERRLTYADYTASGRSLKFIEEYISRVVMPMFANTHTEASATGLQTTRFREEARAIIMKSLNADPKVYDLVFTGTGSTGAINKLISVLGIRIPKQMLKYMSAIPQHERPMIFISQQEHHSNELMWRETNSADVEQIPFNKAGEVDLEVLEQALKRAKEVERRQLIIGSFSAGSNVTGLRSDPAPIASLCHKYGAFACFDYAAAAPYVNISMAAVDGDDKSYLDAVYISPHKFVGGPGTPGLLCVRKDFANCTGAAEQPPSIAGGGTVTMVWPRENNEVCATYEKDLRHREEAGTPGIVEAIRCGLTFHIRNIVGPSLIETLEGQYAKRAVERFQKQGNIWVLGEEFTNISSEHRLSITSFNIRCVINGKPLTKSSGQPLSLHPHYVAALLNDVYGIQSRSGCSCAAPLGFRLFQLSTEQADQIASLADKDGIHSPKPGWCRVNFNYFITEEEFDFICSAIEQIATHGWRLLPLYAVCLRTGMSWFNGVLDGGRSFNRSAAVRSLKELELHKDGTVSWKELPKGAQAKKQYLEDALKIYENAPVLVRDALFRFRDLRRKDQPYPSYLEPLRSFVLGSEILPYLGITPEDVLEAKKSVAANNPDMNPPVVEISLMTDRPRG